MSGIVRSRFSPVISKIRAALDSSASVAANPIRKHSTGISSSSLDQVEQSLKSPPTGSWKEKLGRNSLKYGLLGTAGIVSTTAMFIYHPFEINNSRGSMTEQPIRKMVFDFDEHDLVRDYNIPEVVVRNKFKKKAEGTIFTKPIRKMNFDFDEHDLVRDEDIRKMYDRWMKHYGVSRSRWGKEVHYQAFKERAYLVYFFNRTNEHCKYELNKFADYNEEERKGMRGRRC